MEENLGPKEPIPTVQFHCHRVTIFGENFLLLKTYTDGCCWLLPWKHFVFVAYYIWLAYLAPKTYANGCFTIYRRQSHTCKPMAIIETVHLLGEMNRQKIDENFSFSDEKCSLISGRFISSRRWTVSINAVGSPMDKAYTATDLFRLYL